MPPWTRGRGDRRRRHRGRSGGPRDEPRARHRAGSSTSSSRRAPRARRGSAGGTASPSSAPTTRCGCPGAAYDGDDPGGFMTRTEMAGHLQAYAGRLGRVREGVPVRGLRRAAAAGSTCAPTPSRSAAASSSSPRAPTSGRSCPPPSAGSRPTCRASTCSATATRGRCRTARCSSSAAGRAPARSPRSSRSSGRDVVMACGRAPWFLRAGRRPRPLRVADGLDLLRADARPAAEPCGAARRQHPGERRRRRPRPALPDARRARRAPRGAPGRRSTGTRHGSRPTCPRSSPPATPGSGSCATPSSAVCRDRGVPAPSIPEPGPLDTTAPTELDLRGFGAVVVATGFRSRYTEWIDVPGLVDEQGFPVHVDGESVVAPDLHFVGVHFLRRRRSSLLFGVGDDATATATRIAIRPRPPHLTAAQRSALRGSSGLPRPWRRCRAADARPRRPRRTRRSSGRPRASPRAWPRDGRRAWP